MGSARTSRAPRARAPRTPPFPFYGPDNYIHYTFTNNLHANHYLEFLTVLYDFKMTNVNMHQQISCV